MACTIRQQNPVVVRPPNINTLEGRRTNTTALDRDWNYLHWMIHLGPLIASSLPVTTVVSPYSKEQLRRQRQAFVQEAIVIEVRRRSCIQCIQCGHIVRIRTYSLGSNNAATFVVVSFLPQNQKVALVVVADHKDHRPPSSQSNDDIETNDTKPKSDDLIVVKQQESSSNIGNSSCNDDVRQHPSSSTTTTTNDGCCPICLKDYQPNDEICRSRNNLDCRHVFHPECIEQWLLYHDECPCCRQNYLLGKTTSSSTDSSTPPPPFIQEEDYPSNSHHVRLDPEFWEMMMSIEHMYRQARSRLYYDSNNNNNNSLARSTDGILPSHQQARTTTTYVDMATNEDATRNGTANSEASTRSISTGLDIESGLEVEEAIPDGLASSGGI
jgi:hypothetical protein